MPVRSILAGTGGVDGVTAAGTTETFTLAGSEQVGDVAVAFTSDNSGVNTASTAPAGTTLTGPDRAAGGVLSTYAIAKVLTSGDISTGTFTVTWSASSKNLGVAVVYSGLDLGDLQVGTPAIGTTATSLTAPTVTTLVPNADVYVVAFVQNAQTTAPTLTSFPAGYTSDKVARSAFSTSPNYMVAVSHLTSPGAAGSYGGGTIVVAGTPAHSIVYTIAIAPPTTGTLATTLDGAAFAGTGTVGNSGATGTLAVTLAGATFAATGTETMSGALATTLTGATFAATGTETMRGPLAVTLAGATFAAAGVETISGPLAVTLAGATFAGSGTETIRGTLAVTLAGATFAGTGTGGTAAPLVPDVTVVVVALPRSAAGGYLARTRAVEIHPCTAAVAALPRTRAATTYPRVVEEH